LSCNIAGGYDRCKSTPICGIEAWYVLLNGNEPSPMGAKWSLFYIAGKTYELAHVVILVPFQEQSLIRVLVILGFRSCITNSCGG
jgi:hypothetical protein